MLLITAALTLSATVTVVALLVARRARQDLAREQLAYVDLRRELITAEQQGRDWQTLSQALLETVRSTNPKAHERICRTRSAQCVADTLERIGRVS